MRTARLLRTAVLLGAASRGAGDDDEWVRLAALGDGARARGAWEAMMCARCDESRMRGFPAMSVAQKRRAQLAAFWTDLARIAPAPPCGLANLTAAMPAGSAALEAYLEKVYGRAPSAGAARARAAAWAWDRVELVWERHLPRELRAACARAWPCDPVGFGSVYRAHSRWASASRRRRVASRARLLLSSRETRFPSRARARAPTPRLRSSLDVLPLGGLWVYRRHAVSRPARGESYLSGMKLRPSLSLKVSRPAPAMPAALSLALPPWASAADARAEWALGGASVRLAATARAAVVLEDAGWHEVSHVDQPDAGAEPEGLWMYSAAGSGVWAKLGRTIVGARPRQVWLRLHGVERCEDAPRGAGSCEDVVRKRDVFPEARRQGFDTVVYAFLLARRGRRARVGDGAEAPSSLRYAFHGEATTPAPLAEIIRLGFDVNAADWGGVLAWGWRAEGGACARDARFSHVECVKQTRRRRADAA